MIDVGKYKPIESKKLSSAMILVDAVYFERFIAISNEIHHRLSLLFYHKRKDINLKGSHWDIWSRILYMTPAAKSTGYSEFSQFFYALTGQAIVGKFDDDTLRQMGNDLVAEIRNNNYVFSIEWEKKKTFYYMKKIKKLDYIMERPAMIEWPKKLLESYPEIENARPVVNDDEEED